MSHYLVIDQGNTLLKAGLFNNDRLLRTLVLSSPTLAPIRKLIGKIRPEAILLSTVAATPASFVKSLRAIAPLTVLDKRTPVPIPVRYKTPETLGSDRLAAVIGARALFPGRNVLVI
ncbi:MAG: hypothetical protein RL021_1950, partial [Bacteroidota bacterium]